MKASYHSRSFFLAAWLVCLFCAWGKASSLAVIPVPKAIDTPESRAAELRLGVGKWIWTTNFNDKQTCRFWRRFTLPSTNQLRKATLRITADNQYRVFLDGRQIGEGANWKSLTDYDLVWLLSPGEHVLAVEAFNDGLEAGLLVGLNAEFADGRQMQVLSDNSWRVVPPSIRNWQKRPLAGDWPAAKEVGSIGQSPWWSNPFSINSPPPVLPEVIRFWQTGWFIITVLSTCVLALGLCLYLMTQLIVGNRSQALLERERIRIARDIHDDLGARLTEILLLGEVSRRELHPDTNAPGQIHQMCEKARGLAQAMDEVVWAVNSRRDTLRDFVSYVCKHAQSYLEATSIRCRLDIEPDLPEVALDLPVRRNLFLSVKEALNNAAKHSGASELHLRIRRQGQKLRVIVEDNGNGFDAGAADTIRNGLINLQDRMAEAAGTCQITSSPGNGCSIELLAPLNFKKRPAWSAWLRSRSHEDPDTLKVAYREPGGPESIP